jgi:hypothetical protein
MASLIRKIQLSLLVLDVPSYRRIRQGCLCNGNGLHIAILYKAHEHSNRCRWFPSCISMSHFLCVCHLLDIRYPMIFLLYFRWSFLMGFWPGFARWNHVCLCHLPSFRGKIWPFDLRRPPMPKEHRTCHQLQCLPGIRRLWRWTWAGGNWLHLRIGRFVTIQA